MKRLTSEEVRADESMDRYLGPLADLEGMKPKLLDLVLNGPALNGVSKDVLRQIIRQLYRALAAYEGTGLEPEEVDKLTKDWNDLCTVLGECGGIDALRELAEANKDGRLAVLPRKTRQSVFLEQYPEAELGKDGVLRVCPAPISPKYRSDGRCATFARGCADCRREFWGQEVK